MYIQILVYRRSESPNPKSSQNPPFLMLMLMLEKKRRNICKEETQHTLKANILKPNVDQSQSRLSSS